MRRVSFLLLLLSLSALPVYPDESREDLVQKMDENGYTINYNTVSIIEYIRFASKICNTNFIYNTNELNFSVSVISDAPITPENVMATLIQVLRIHGMMLLEQDNNLVIHRSAEVKQLATLVTGKNGAGKAPIVTRVFRVMNAKPDSLAAIIRPMISAEALLEISPETRQLIITDVTANVDKVASLIEILDSPHTPLDIKSYEAVNNKLEFLIETANQIMTPITQGNPFILVPQPLAGSIFIVSTPELVERTISILQTIDSPPREGMLTHKKLSSENILIFNAEHKSGGEVLTALEMIGENIAKAGIPEGDLEETIKSGKFIPQTNALMFIGSMQSIAKVKEFLTAIDIPSKKQTTEDGVHSTSQTSGKQNYYIYKLQHTSADVIEEDLENLVKSFKASGVKDSKLIQAIENIRHVKETNSFLITGDPHSIEEVKQLLTDYDYPRAMSKSAQSNFLMYKPVNTTASQVEKSLREVAINLKKADLADPNLLAAIDSIKYIDATNSLLFTGTPEALQKLQVLIKDVDTPTQSHAPIQHVGKTSFLLYKLKNGSGSQVIASLKTLSMDLKKSGASDKEFIAALQSAKYIRETHSILFTGSEKALERVEAFAAQFDVLDACNPKAVSEDCVMPATNFFAYKPVSLTGPDLEAITHDFADNLKLSGLSDPELFNAIHSMRWVDQTQTLIFTGSPKALDQIKQLITSFDIPGNLPSGSPSSVGESSIQGVDNTNFLVYKLQYHKGDEIQSALRQIAKDLISTGASINIGLLNAINSIQWIQITNSLLCSGDPETLNRLRDLIKSLDLPLKQVFIEMLVIETNLLNALEFGLEWGGKYKYRNKFQGSINNIGPSPTGAPCTVPAAMQELNNFQPTVPMPNITQFIPFNCGFDLGIIGQVIKHNGQTFLSLGSLLSALQTDDETSVILTPKIITQDGRTSTIFVGSNVPFVGSFVNTSGQNTVQTSNIEYRDVGLNLTITPVLGNSDIVTLDINLDRSQTLTDLRGNQLNLSTPSANGIITSKTTMQTTVHVPDKNFLILSGFVNNSNVKSTSGIPCLGGLPLIGAAFSKDNNTSNSQNIVIFLRPHIINSVEDLRRVTEDQEDAFRDQQGTPFLIHQFDEGMELIKSIDDD